jgi:hypothetical protein
VDLRPRCLHRLLLVSLALYRVPDLSLVTRAKTLPHWRQDRPQFLPSVLRSTCQEHPSRQDIPKASIRKYPSHHPSGYSGDAPLAFVRRTASPHPTPGRACHETFYLYPSRIADSRYMVRSRKGLRDEVIAEGLEAISDRPLEADETLDLWRGI